MNYRFKFRVWDIKQQKYRQKTHHEADTCLNCLTGKVLFGEGIEIYGEEDDKDVILEQCTGLKDKNGKLIYENDVLEVSVFDKNNYSSKKKTRWSVEYKIFNNNIGFMVYGINRRWHALMTSNMLYNAEAVVIGNIHENADLLENEE